MSNLDIDRGKRYLPQKVLTPKISHIFEEVIQGGEFEIKRLNFSGEIDQLTHLNNPSNFKLLSGEIGVRNLSLTTDKGKHIFSGLNGLVVLKSGELFFTDATGNYENFRITSMNGSIVDVLSSFFIKIFFKANADISQIKGFLLKTAPNLTKLLNYQLVDSSGIVKADVSISGPINDPSPISITWDAELKDITMNYNKYKLQFKNINGSIHFSENMLDIKKLDWNMGGSQFKTNGIIKEFKSTNPFLDINLYSTLNLKELGISGIGELDSLRNFLTPQFVKSLTLSGVSELNLKLKGTKGNFTISEFTIDLTNAAYKYPRFEKNMGLFNKIQLSGRVNSETIYIHNIKISFGSAVSQEKADINIYGKLSDFNNLNFNLSTYTNEINIIDIAKLLGRTEDSDISGKISIEFNTNGKLKKIKDTKFKGKLLIKNADFKPSDLPFPVKDIHAIAEFNEKSVFISSSSGFFGDSPIRFNANIKDLNNPIVEFNLYTSSINLDEFLFPQLEKEVSGEKKSDSLLSRVIWKGKISINKGEFREIPLEGLKCDIYYSQEMIKINNLLFNGFDGKYTGNGWVKWDRSEGMELSMENKIVKMDIENLHRKLPRALHDLHGSINLSGRISGKGGDFDEIKSSLNGNVYIKIDKGNIKRFHILSKIFSLLNVYQILKFKLPDLITEGMPYDSITANFEIKDGIASTEDFLIESDSMRITAIGKIDTKDNNVDMIVGVQPFQTIDKIISNIPFAGRILTGDKRALIVFYYTVKGGIDDPKVTPIPLESLGEGVLGIVRRLLTAE
jgi:uncharacterized protein YhdP